ncbi:MAG: hypothetical protein GXX86_13195 [Propionibacterium sp.]|nr:hypothetical protein [Propionibacterium sp.]
MAGGPPPGQPMGSGAGRDTLPPEPGAKKNRKPLIIAIVGVIVLALAVTGAVLWKRHADEQAAIRAEEGRQATIARKTESARGAVEDFFTALGDHDLDAISALTVQDLSSPAINAEVLAATHPEAPANVTVEVTSPIDENTTSATVEATFGPEDSPKEMVFSVQEADTDVWKLDEVAVPLDLSREEPVKLNGVAIENTTMTVPVLPGTYTVTPTNPHLTTAEGNTPVEAYDMAGGAYFAGDFTLTDKAVAEFRTSATNTINECMKKKELNPEGCPWKLTETNDIKVLPNTIVFKMLENPWSKLTPTYNASSNQAEGSITWQMRIDAEATQNGRRGTTGTDFTAGGRATADLSGDTITVQWTG